VSEPLPEPQNELEEELLRAPEGSAQREGLRKALASAEVLVPDPESDGELGTRVIRGGEALTVPAWELEGERFIPAFSSEARLVDAIPAGSNYLRMPLAALTELIDDGTEVKLNPGGPFEVKLPSAKPEVRRYLPPGGQFAIGEPATEPTALLDAVAGFAAQRPEIVTAWRALVKLDEAPPHPLIGLELTPGADADSVLPTMIARLEGEGHSRFTAVAVDPQVPDAFSDYLLNKTRPFWSRGE
jgi:hypothetical protein